MAMKRHSHIHPAGDRADAADCGDNDTRSLPYPFRIVRRLPIGDDPMHEPIETTVLHVHTPDGPLVPPAHIKRLINHVVNADHVYFRAHPGVTKRERRYIPGEAWPLDPGDVNRVTVLRLSETKQARCYHRTSAGDR